MDVDPVTRAAPTRPSLSPSPSFATPPSRERTRTRTPSAPGRPPSPMPRRPGSAAPFHPAADTGTYRDLLLFEERLKMNAEMLRRRRRRYRIFLWSVIAVLVVCAYCLLTRPPENIVSLRALQAALAVVGITLTLFFASGMHDDKIRYAHAYITHSNKALRPLNMYLNVRRPPTTWYSLVSLLPLPAALKPTPAALRAAPKSPGPKGRRVSHGQQVMAQIPPSSNPRGELIFSSRVGSHFEEGYKRYRSAFERRREERAREEARAAGPFWRLWRKPTPISRRGTPDQTARSPPSSPRNASRSPSPKERERADSYSFMHNNVAPGEAVSASARA
ncbi:uncharacterized protein CcaverHIS019_0601780 [Cutaneotrichosporon cavernicola]|uniref:Transmembrane protein 188 n=1 Tax=Cutaneotrichosporon cavernicola TaxID=279322 RepID=A0AA48QXM6_9TREE|nr:uncharacterized protein CcaverHIS019_0601780 [Cutaneotrichosporon cavernicola]BEI93719.1 hypothetical protein CcaverHIS019_0601780 [Cutaneotrichosporon cavernicola]BEJ01497.1 hypothetical protein CcaverHIS631_0601790 [Cutaneotrichosporon cavernicola]BEJ09262.1 hypothetical protein CcaverHIS641_0601770 [Cutaneotrichosporon cavernicola]